MKKTYLSALLIGLTSTVGFSQSVQKTLLKRKVSTEQPVSAPTVYTPKVLGQEIWLDDFSTPGNWTIDNDGQTGPTFGWNINATKESWTFGGGVNMTGNYAEVGNGNPTANPGTQAIGVEYTMTTGPLDVPALALAQTGVATSEVILEFKEYGARFNDDQRVQISTDGNTFTTIRDNSGYEMLTAGGGSAYPNPATVSVNIAPYISGNPTNVYIRFSWTSIAPASTNPNVWVAYGWFIDDVRLLTKPTNDIVAKPYFWGVEGELTYNTYYQTPTTQVAPILFSAIGVNDGATPQTNVTLNVDVASGTFTGTSPAGLTIAPNAQDTAEVSTTFTPPATVASYPTTWNLSQTEVDDVPANNTIPGFTFEVTDHTYAVDNGIASGNIYNQGLAYSIGAWYDIFNSQDLFGIEVKLNSATVDGTIVRGVLYEVNVVNNALDYSEVATSGYHDIVAADKVGFLTLELTSPYSLQANQTYMVVIETEGDGGTGDDLVVNLAQPTENFIGFKDENGDWYTGFAGGTNAPMVRMLMADINPPVADVDPLADVTAECTVASIVAPTATDAWVGAVTGTTTTTFPITTVGTTVVTWTYDDGNGNISTQDQNVIITEPGIVPDLATLADYTGYCTIDAAEMTSIAPTAALGCTASLTATHDATLPITTPGTTVVTWTYDDGNGNTVTQTQNIILDAGAGIIPDMAILTDITSECSVTSLTAPTATVDCSANITGTTTTTFPITTAGTTTVTWTYDDGNGNTLTQLQDVIITPINNGITQVSATELSADATGAYTYQWVDCGNGNANVSGATNQTFIPAVAGSYACVVDNGTCSVTTACLTSTVGIEENTLVGISIYPNPTEGKLTITNKNNYNNTIEVVNLAGKVIYTGTSNKTESLDLSGNGAGVYFVNITNELGSITEKVILK